LSIPFFSLGGNMHSRTRSLMATLTRTDTNDWLIGLRRGPPAVPVPGDADVERAIGDSRTATVVMAHDDVPVPEDNRAEGSSKELVRTATYHCLHLQNG
jgi:hypothetical protein